MARCRRLAIVADDRVRVRPFEARDLDALYRICLLTGDGGADASALYDDPRLLGHVYAGPYGALEPEHAFVLEDDDEVCGYTVGALDTPAFCTRVRERWLPALQRRYPDPPDPPEAWSRDERMMHLLHHPDRAFPLTLPDALEPFPSHLHIDLLPRAQGRGWGRRLMAALLERMAADGSPGVHLGVGTSNARALGFYRHLGFARLFDEAGGRAVVMARGLERPAARP